MESSGVCAPFALLMTSCTMSTPPSHSHSCLTDIYYNVELRWRMQLSATCQLPAQASSHFPLSLSHDCIRIFSSPARTDFCLLCPFIAWFPFSHHHVMNCLRYVIPIHTPPRDSYPFSLYLCFLSNICCTSNCSLDVLVLYFIFIFNANSTSHNYKITKASSLLLLFGFITHVSGACLCC